MNSNRLRSPGKRSARFVPLIAAVVLAGLALPAFTEARTFTSTDGRTIEGEVVRVEKETALLKLAGGRTVNVPFRLLVDADRAYLEDWVRQEALNRIPRVDVKVESNKRDTVVQQGYDDRRGSVQFEIEVTNEERNFTIEGAKATLVVFGDYLYEDDALLVMQKVEFKDIKIAFSESKRLAAKQVRYEYDKRDYTHGVKYDGYVFVLKNSAGKVIDVSGSSERVENLQERILELKEGEYCNERYQKITRGSTRSSILR